MVICDSLEKRGLVRRVKNPEDRRENLIEITDDGQAVFLKAKKIMDAYIQKIANGIGPEELESTTNTLQSIYSTICDLEGK